MLLKQLNHRVRAILFTLLWLQAAVAVAATQEYDIELLVIEDTSSRYAQSEKWPSISEETTTKNNKKIPADIEKLIKRLPDSSYRLDDEAKRITNSNEYKVLLHTAWRQAGMDTNLAFPIPIDSNNASENVTGSYIEGDVTFVMSRYLHLSGNLILYKQEQNGYAPYPIEFNRRMRSRETHYIDHPLLGIVVLATPVKR